MQNSDPPQFCHYNYLCNIWYLIFLIQSFNLTSSCRYLFYKQRILADFWSWKDSVIGIKKLFIAHSMCKAQWHLHRCTCDWHKSECYLIGLKMQYLWNINIPGNADWSCLYGSRMNRPKTDYWAKLSVLVKGCAHMGRINHICNDIYMLPVM